MEWQGIIALVNNAAQLLALSVIYEVTYYIPSRYQRLRPIFSGILIGLICIAIMSMPYTLQPGVIYDTRSILISLTALIFGAIPTVITVVAAALYRLSIGGAGALPGITVITTSALIGLAWRHWFFPKSIKWRWVSVYLMSICVHLTMLACMLLLPYPESLNVIRAIAIPVMVIYPIGSVVLNLLLIRQQELRQIKDELHYLVEHDDLTGLFNRRYYENEINRLHEAKYLPLSIIVADINGLKLINDSFGHSDGDRMIIEASKILKECCRNGELLFRTGGDEFSILLPRTELSIALKRLSEIQTACKNYNLQNNDEALHVNLSLGAAVQETLETDFKFVSKVAQDYMNQRKLLEKKSSYNAIIASIKATMNEKSHETEEHSERMSLLSHELGLTLNLSQIELNHLELLAKLHDIGKIGISEQILKKPGKLNDLEWAEMKKHPEIGFRIAMSSPNLAPIAEYILYHHERWDGQGYPQNLKEMNIPLLSRIIGIVDAYDAMTEDRIYRRGITHEEAIAEVKKCAGTQFDPQIAEAFVQILENRKTPIHKS